ncbi:MAG: hypothetical protein WC775_03450 [Patescibacteria group bacterium]
MKTIAQSHIIKIRIVKDKKDTKSTGFNAELRKLIALKQRLPLQFVG